MTTSKAFGNVFKLSGILSVKDPLYGAKGDGVSDDTAAINLALAAGNNVYFPPGTYLVTGTGLRFTGTYQKRTTIKGAGIGRSIITYTGAGSAIAETTNTRCSVEIGGLSIYRTGAYGSTIGLNANAWEDSDLHDLLIDGFASGVEAGTVASGDCFRVTLRDSVVKNCNYGVRMEGTTTHVLPCNANNILRTFFNECSESVYIIDGCNNNHVEMCDFETASASDAIYINGNDNYLGPNYFEIPAGVKVNIAAGIANRVFGLSHAGSSGSFVNSGTDTIIIDRGEAILPGTVKVGGAFGCNTKAVQTAYASGGALNAYGAGANGFDTAGNASALHALVVSIRAALVANGIMS